MGQQQYKAIYFDDYQSDTGKGKSFTIAFGEDDFLIYNKVRALSSYEFKKILECESYQELKDKAENEGRTVNQYAKRVLSNKVKNIRINTIQTKDVTFGNSKDIPFQRWYPYIEGYSPNFVKSLIQTYCPQTALIYEPFAGTGTTLFSADLMGIDTVYSEVNPLLRYLILAKTMVMKMPAQDRQTLSAKLLSEKTNIFTNISKQRPDKDLDKSYKDVFGNSVYFPEDQYKQILKLKSYTTQLDKSGERELSVLLNVAIFACLIPVSFLKKQGDLRFKTEKERLSEMHTLSEVLPVKIQQVSDDVANLDFRLEHNHTLLSGNAKLVGEALLKSKISSVITSPPYLNGTNYFRNTKLELWYLAFLKSDKDLRSFRDEALTSGINDVKLDSNNDRHITDSPLLEKTIAELERKAYDRRIPVMAKCYFEEMFEVFSGLSHHLKDGAEILIDLGDSIFSNVHIQTDKILVETLRSLGYELQKRIVLRQRRSRNGELLSQVLLVIIYKAQ